MLPLQHIETARIPVVRHEPIDEVAFSGLFMNGEMLLVGGGTMQVAVLQLAVTVISTNNAFWEDYA